MSEPVVEAPVVEAAVEAPVVQAPVTIDPTEQSARDQGWVSKEEWVDGGKSENDWRPAKEFVDRGELYKSIHSTKRELKATQAVVTALQKHNQFIFEKAYSKAKSDLKLEKRQAIREGDLERLEDVEDQIEKLDEQHVQERQALVQPAPRAQQADFDAFVDRNPWYTSDADLKDEADAIGFIYINKGGNQEGLLKHVEDKMKKKFPEKFGVRRAAPSPTASGDKTLKANKDDVVLSEMEQDIMKTLVASGTLTEKEYKAQIKKAKDIK